MEIPSNPRLFLRYLNTESICTSSGCAPGRFAYGVYLFTTTPAAFTFQMVGPPSSQIQKYPSLSTTIPSESIPQISLLAVFELKFAQFNTVSVDATSVAVLPYPVGLIMPVAVVP